MNRQISQDGRRKSYLPQDMAEAMLKVQEGLLAIPQAAQLHGVPRSSLWYNLKKNRHSPPATKEGTNTPKEQRTVNKMTVGIKSPPGFEMSQPLNCCFCGRGDENEVEFGKIYTIDDVSVHYYCLLFSSGLAQNGEDDEGVLGFLAEDIVKEVQRGRKLSCCYCLRKGATIGCYNKKCRRTYHYPCGIKQNALCKFSNDFRSYCSHHREYQKGFGSGEELECPICMEELIANPNQAIWAPCCKRKTWFHKLCLQRLALSAGYFFKCPLCNDKDVFQLEMQNLGIFVPEKDASWELEPNAFSELLERPIHCDAPKCKCPDGRKTDVEGTRWEVLLCNLCGSTGVHIQCGALPFVCTEWNCPTCVNMLSESFKRTQQEERQRRLNERKSKISDCEDLASDNLQGCSSSAASGSVAMDVLENRETLTPGKRKREDVETGMETPPKMRHLEGMECFSKITYASDSDEEIDVESGEYQVPPHTNIRELEELGEELPKKLRKLKNYALWAQERMQELRLTEADIVRIAKEAAHSKDIALDKSQVTRFFRYKLPLEKMLPVAELIRKVFAYREAMVLEAQTSSAGKKKGGTSTPSRRGRRKSGTPTIKIPLLKTAISQSLITTGISPSRKEKPLDMETVNTNLPESWSMYRASKTIGKLTSGLDTETDPVDFKPDSIIEAQSEGKVKEKVPESKADVSVTKEDENHQESVDRNLGERESETEMSLFLSPLSSQGSMGSKSHLTETRTNKENEGVNQDDFQSSQARRKLLLNSNNQIAKETAESSLPGGGGGTTNELLGGNPSTERYGCVLRNMQVVSNSPTTKVPGPGVHEDKNKKKRKKRKKKIPRLEFDVTLMNAAAGPTTRQKQDLLESKPQTYQQVNPSEVKDAAEQLKLPAKKTNGEVKGQSSTRGRKKHTRSGSRDKNKYIQKSLSPFIVKQKK
ncbi:uncharacterized protein [Penaeus vannamei]|uniref:uncharacterized protein isoform X6 n=1 Tax=Penaeus vannamei TaxID=6689 RepID=UPI00387F4198